MNTEEIKKFQDKKIRIKTASGFVYETQNLHVIDSNTISFTDKFGFDLILSNDEIALIISAGGDNGKK